MITHQFGKYKVIIDPRTRYKFGCLRSLPFLDSLGVDHFTYSHSVRKIIRGIPLYQHQYLHFQEMQEIMETRTRIGTIACVTNQGLEQIPDSSISFLYDHLFESEKRGGFVFFVVDSKRFRISDHVRELYNEVTNVTDAHGYETLVNQYLRSSYPRDVWRTLKAIPTRNEYLLRSYALRLAASSKPIRGIQELFRIRKENALLGTLDFVLNYLVLTNDRSIDVDLFDLLAPWIESRRQCRKISATVKAELRRFGGNEVKLQRRIERMRNRTARLIKSLSGDHSWSGALLRRYGLLGEEEEGSN